MEKDTGFPPEFASFIKEMNQSLIDLNQRENKKNFSDQLEKEPESKIRFTKELKVNPNLPEKFQPKRNDEWSYGEAFKRG